MENGLLESQRIIISQCAISVHSTSRIPHHSGTYSSNSSSFFLGGGDGSNSNEQHTEFAVKATLICYHPAAGYQVLV